MFSKRFLFPAVVALVVCVWVGFEFTAGRQLERVFHRLINAAENRNWEKVRQLVAEDYRDGWGQDREQAISTGSQFLGQFLVMEIVVENQTVDLRGREASIAARMRLKGRGSAVAEAIMQGANALEHDFQFAWRRKSWKPWDWKLVSINQSEIQFDPMMLP